MYSQQSIRFLLNKLVTKNGLQGAHLGTGKHRPDYFEVPGPQVTSSWKPRPFHCENTFAYSSQISYS